VSVVAVGRIKEKYLKDGIAEYSKRLTGIIKLNLIELNDEGGSASPGAAEILHIKNREGQRLLSAIPDNCYTIALDLGGKQLGSEQLAQKIADLTLCGCSHIVFIIGGSWGLSEAVLRRADYRLSFGGFTFPHQLMRLILLEQIYRSFKIIRNEPYHK
ncbi:MAG: 23S rRNA (pseudouridine(1915)-N(3))-methyltransferase RlmH, partial [Clostridiales bacterium]